jgi:hypothetical protein
MAVQQMSTENTLFLAAHVHNPSDFTIDHNA